MYQKSHTSILFIFFDIFYKFSAYTFLFYEQIIRVIQTIIGSNFKGQVSILKSSWPSLNQPTYWLLYNNLCVSTAEKQLSLLYKVYYVRNYSFILLLTMKDDDIVGIWFLYNFLFFIKL